MTNFQLIQGCCENDERSQRKFYERFFNPMYCLCLRYMGEKECAKETVQEGFIYIFPRLNKCVSENDAQIEAWVKTVFKNHCLQKLRVKRPNLLEISTDPAKMEMEDVGNKENIFSDITKEDIQLLIMKLPDGYRTVFNLYVIEEHAHAEIAKMLGITENNSKVQLHKARLKLEGMVRELIKYYESGVR